MVTLKVKVLRGIIEKSKGLLGFKRPSPVLIYTRFGVHTFFLKFPIDVLVLNKNNQVVKISCLKPNRIFFWSPFFNKVLELPEGEVEKNKIKIGDKIKLAIEKILI